MLRCDDTGKSRGSRPVGWYVVLVRCTPGEFADGHVQGALNVPVQVLESRIAELDPARPVVVYCRSGNRSAMDAFTEP